MKRRSQLSSAGQLLASILLISLLMFSVPALAGFVGEARATDSKAVALNLAAAPEAAVKVPETVQTPATETPVELTASRPKQAAPVPVVKKAAPAAKAYTTKRKARTVRKTTTAAKPAGSELARAKAILASMIARYPILAGTTLSFGKTPGGYQAVTYYKSGRILISPTHTASLDRIVKHEAWHVIDWRDNGRIDWGENVPR